MSWSISMSDTSFIELTINQVILYFHRRNVFFAVKLCKVQTSAFLGVELENGVISTLIWGLGVVEIETKTT